MVKSKKLWGWAGAGLLAAVLAWTGWQVWQVNQDLNDAVRHGKNIQAAVEARDTAALDREFDALRESSRAAADRTSGVTWSVLTTLPLFGDDAEGIEVTSRVLDDLARDGVEPLVTASDRFEELLPKDGAIDVEVARDLATPVADAQKAFATANEDLAAVDASGFVGRLDEQFSTFRDQVARATDALGSAKVATDVLPTLLGGDGERHYLLVFQNNAEIRGTGGLAGAASYIQAKDGRLELQNHSAGSRLGEAPGPVLPLTDVEVDLYSKVFGTYFLNAGMTPDVPRASDLLRARWEQKFPEQPVDGVLMVDAVAMGYLLGATGPIEVDGIQLTGDNVVDELLHNSYLRLPDPAQQDVFFAAVAAASFDKFTSGVGDPTALLKALSRAADERRVFVHSYDDDVQSEIDGTAISGDFITDPEVDEPQIAVTLNDTTGAKMSYYLRYDVDITATSCADGVQTYTAKARIQSTAPADAGTTLPDYITGGGQFGVEPGTQIVTFRIFAPTGGALGDLDFNGAKSEILRADQDGRPVGMTYVQLAPGQTVDLAWTMKSGAGQTGDTVVAVTPTIEKKNSAQQLSSACASEGR